MDLLGVKHVDIPALAKLTDNPQKEAHFYMMQALLFQSQETNQIKECVSVENHFRKSHNLLKYIHLKIIYLMPPLRFF